MHFGYTKHNVGNMDRLIRTAVGVVLTALLAYLNQRVIGLPITVVVMAATLLLLRGRAARRFLARVLVGQSGPAGSG